jgi:hypothetical protein
VLDLRAQPRGLRREFALARFQLGRALRADGALLELARLAFQLLDGPPQPLGLARLIAPLFDQDVALRDPSLDAAQLRLDADPLALQTLDLGLRALGRLGRADALAHLRVLRAQLVQLAVETGETFARGARLREQIAQTLALALKLFLHVDFGFEFGESSARAR